MRAKRPLLLITLALVLAVAWVLPRLGLWRAGTEDPRAEQLELYRRTFEDPADAEVCLDCAEAIVMAGRAED